MPDFGAPVAQNVQPPSVAQTLGQLIGLRQQQQQLQSGALQIEQQQQNLAHGAADTQQAQQTAAQRQGIANIDWSKYDDGTGTISTDKMLSDAALQKSAGDQFPQLLQQAALARTQQLQNKQALVNLNDGLRNQFGSIVGSLRTDPDVIADNPEGRQKVAQAIEQFGASGGPDAARVAEIYAPVATHAPPGQLVRGISAIQLQAMDASRQAAAQAPGYVNTGGTLKNTNPQAAGGNLEGSPNIATTLPPGMHTFQDQAGNTWAFNPQQPGQATLVGHGGAPAAASPAPAAPGAGATPAGPAPQGDAPAGGRPQVSTQAELAAIRDSIPYLQQDIKRAQASGDQGAVAAAQRQLADAQARLASGSPWGTAAAPSQSGGAGETPPYLNVGEAAQVHANTQTVAQNRQAAQNAQIEHDVLGRIQSLAATPGLYLGPGSQELANLATMVSQVPGFEGAAKYANNYNELVKFMAQNAARQGQSMGLSGSDARLDMATHAQPNANPMDSRTVQNVAQYMGGIVRMNLAKADAMDRWLQEPGHSLQNEHEFERLWRDNADPRLFQLAEMKDQGDASNYARLHISKSELQALQKKHDTLVKLGALPGAQAPAPKPAPQPVAAAGGASGAW